MIDNDTIEFISKLEKMDDRRFVAWEESLDPSFAYRQVIGTGTSFYKVLGKVYSYILECQSSVDNIDIAEGEEGICLEYKYAEDDKCNYCIFILWDKSSIKKEDETNAAGF